MTKQEFLQRLSRLLADVTVEEREEALRYYEEYFDEAGPEQEQAVLAELGSPEKVAAIIKANVPGSRIPPAIRRRAPGRRQVPRRARPNTRIRPSIRARPRKTTTGPCSGWWSWRRR